MLCCLFGATIYFNLDHSIWMTHPNKCLDFSHLKCKIEMFILTLKYKFKYFCLNIRMTRLIIDFYFGIRNIVNLLSFYSHTVNQRFTLILTHIPYMKLLVNWNSLGILAACLVGKAPNASQIPDSSGFHRTWRICKSQ